MGQELRVLLLLLEYFLGSSYSVADYACWEIGINFFQPNVGDTTAAPVLPPTIGYTSSVFLHKRVDAELDRIKGNYKLHFTLADIII